MLDYYFDTSFMNLNPFYLYEYVDESIECKEMALISLVSEKLKENEVDITEGTVYEFFKKNPDSKPTIYDDETVEIYAYDELRISFHLLQTDESYSCIKDFIIFDTESFLKQMILDEEIIPIKTKNDKRFFVVARELEETVEKIITEKGEKHEH